MDTERIKDKLSELLVYIAELDEDIPDTEDEYIEERRTRRACERTFQLACEDVLDICNLIIAGKSLGLPKDNRDAIRKLADDKIIPKKLSDSLEDMV
ncbi:MAG: HepT-like ribonuclease domain-containing protein, partial [Candidatus Methanoperedens sp.]